MGNIQNPYSQIELKTKQLGEKAWEIIVRFNNNEKTFVSSVWNDDPKNHKAACIQNMLIFYAEFPNGVPSLDEYREAYLDDEMDMEEVRRQYQEDVLNEYVPALELFGEYVAEIYYAADEVNFPKMKN